MDGTFRRWQVALFADIDRAILIEQRQLSERQGASRRFFLLISNRLPAASALPLTGPKTEFIGG